MKRIATIAQKLSIADLSDAETDFLDGVTAGTVTASKALVVDANKDIASIRHPTLSGNQVTSSNVGTATVKTTTPTASPFAFVVETGDPHTIYLNVADTWAASGDNAATLSGTAVLH